MIDQVLLDELRLAIIEVSSYLAGVDTLDSTKLDNLTVAELTVEILSGTFSNATRLSGQTATELITELRGVGTETVGSVRSKLDAYIARRDNPHNLTKDQVGLDLIDNWGPGDIAVVFDTQQVIDAAVNSLIDNMGDTITTIGQLARAIDEDPDFYTNITAAVEACETPAGAAAKLATFAERTDNPNVVTKAQVGLSSLANGAPATEEQALAGTGVSAYTTPLRLKQQVDNKDYLLKATSDDLATTLTDLFDQAAIDILDTVGL